MRLLLSVILCVSLLSSAALMAANKEVGIWEVLENCQLVQADYNDGDSFLIKYGDQSDVFRLYYVDCPETYATYMDRVRDQARYFSITTDEVLASGELASKFSKLFLRGSFTVITKWEDARGSGKQRYYALIKKDERYLSTELVQNGLARIYGMPTKQAWPTGDSPRTYLSRLKNAEREAQRSSTGIWAVGGSSAQMAGLDQLRQSVEGDNAAPMALSQGTPRRASSKNGMLNVNTATAAELETLPGIGPALAGRIIAARPIATIDSLVEISGISDKTLNGFRSLIIVTEPPPPLKTVDFYFADLPQYLNKDITLVIASVISSEANSPESFRSVRLKTAYEGESGGGITAFIPDEFYDSFIQYYREPGRELTGLLYEREGETVLVYRRK